MINKSIIEGGTILHTWCWSFNTIKENIPEIANAGYTAIQTSPIGECRVGEDGGLELFGHGKWYYHYQPTKHVIGNYQLGTRDEFKAMCDEAHKYGIKVIVDAVINHCSMEYSCIDDSVKNIEGGAFHEPMDWDETNRYSETQGFLNGLWDLNTQNPNVQKHLKNFLLDCVDAGADGFRYDTAKLIELPDDKSDGKPEYASNFWPYVLDNGTEFQYGEDLQEGGEDATSSRLGAYAELMKVTASFYGARIRKAVSEKNLKAEYIGDYLAYGVNPMQLVTWVESHDNYCNDRSYAELNDDEVICAWAIIAGRQQSTPLFFNRPSGSTSDNPWGDNKIGPKGNDSWRDKRVVAVNRFRDAFRNTKDELINPNDSSVIILREDKGAVIVNCSKTPLKLSDFDVKKLPTGEYTDKVTGTLFTVTDKGITGNVDSMGIAVLIKE
ncbi:MAG: alpha-amylase family glycosyl hydrolase [Ruminococcus sp.]